MRWWGDFTLQTRLMAGATADGFPLIMSGLTFWAVNTIQQDDRLNDTRFARDLGLLLAANVAPMVVRRKTALSWPGSPTAFTRAPQACATCSMPTPTEKFSSAFPSPRRQCKIPLPCGDGCSCPMGTPKIPTAPWCASTPPPRGGDRCNLWPLNYNGNHLGVLALGINPNPTVVAYIPPDARCHHCGVCFYLGDGDPWSRLQRPDHYPTH